MKRFMRQTATVDPEKCDPTSCPGGICSAATACPRRLIKQEAPNEVPFVAGDPSLCRGCFNCLQACPRGAIVKW